MRRALNGFAVVLTVLGSAATAAARAAEAITVTSSAFDDGGAIPRQFTCEGKSLPPPICCEINMLHRFLRQKKSKSAQRVFLSCFAMLTCAM